MSKKWIKERCPDCENKLDNMGMYNYCHNCKEYKFAISGEDISRSIKRGHKE